MTPPGHAGRHEQEVLSDDDLDIIGATRKTLADKDIYTKSDKRNKNVVDASITSETASEDDVVEVDPPARGRKRSFSTSHKIEWSADEDDDAYENFKKRKLVKRKQTADTRKRVKKRAKDAEVGKQQTGLGGDPDDEMAESLPEYLQSRRKKFEKNRKTLAEAGLRLPPDYKGIEFSDDERLEDLKERPNFPESVRPSRKYEDIELPHSLGLIPASIAQYLRDYQIDGVSFLHELFVYQKGGILGDDMGLGKTVQVATFLTVAFGKTGDERDAKRMRKMRRAGDERWYPRVLVVCPGSLIENWKNELKQWGWWHVDSFHGDSKEDVLSAASSGRVEVVITTYQTYRMYKSKLNMIEWDCVIADECHQLKERSSEITKAMNEINAMCRIGLSGTAIQNKYEELWTLLDWTNPGRFGSLSVWKSTISEPLRVGQSHDATIYQLSRARKTAKKLVENLLPQFFLRRVKSLIAHQLPKKSDKVVFCELTEIQQEAYERFLESEIVHRVRCSSDPCECQSGRKRGWCCHEFLSDGKTKWQVLVFPVIVALQKLSNHLALLIPNANDQREKQQRDLDFLKAIVPDKWRELYSNRDSLLHLSNPAFCGKWRILKNLLRFWHGNGDKVLVFSHSVKLLKMLQLMFQNTSYNVSFLDGSMPYADRQRTVDEFNSNPEQFVFLISTKAGGVGLNITSANKVVIMDPNWNPTYDLQAQDRAYRIGQVRDVEVFRLVSVGTVEEIVYARQIYKQQQANIGYNASNERRYFKGIQNQKGQQGEIFGLQNLLTYNGDGIVLRDIVNKTNVAEAKADVKMADINMDDVDEDNPSVAEDDGEDAAMSQLAALITEGQQSNASLKARPQTNAVQAILASAGVKYTHENSEVVGSSKVEARLSRRAEETGNNVAVADEVLFGGSSEVEETVPDAVQYVFHPPADVRRRQFCTMARTFGFDSAVEFALIVEGWTQEQRRNCLDAFYRRRRDALADREHGDAAGGEPAESRHRHRLDEHDDERNRFDVSGKETTVDRERDANADNTTDGSDAVESHEHDDEELGKDDDEL